MSIGDFTELLGISEDAFESESSTVGGWTLEKFGAFPQEGDSFTDDGLEEMASFAQEINSRSEDIGARRLYTIMEKVLADISFDAPEMPGAQVVINRDYVREHLTDVREDQDLSQYIL